MTCQPPSVNQSAIQRHAARGYAMAAIRLGAPSRQFRPSAKSDPMTGTPYAIVRATFNDDPAFSFRRPIVWDKPICYALLDTTDINPGDLVVTPEEGTFFITRYEPFRPVEAILTNAIVTVSGSAGSGDQGDDTGACDLAGAQGGYGSSATASVALVTGWPAWIGKPARGISTQSGVPGSLPAATFLMRFPLVPGWAPRPYMTVETDQGLLYTISGVSSSQYGHECLMSVQQV